MEEHLAQEHVLQPSIVLLILSLPHTPSYLIRHPTPLRLCVLDKLPNCLIRRSLEDYAKRYAWDIVSRNVPTPALSLAKLNADIYSDWGRSCHYLYVCVSGLVSYIITPPPLPPPPPQNHPQSPHHHHHRHRHRPAHRFQSPSQTLHRR